MKNLKIKTIMLRSIGILLLVFCIVWILIKISSLNCGGGYCREFITGRIYYRYEITQTYYKDLFLTGVDRGTFTSIGDGHAPYSSSQEIRHNAYAKDKNNAYYDGTHIPGADAQSFTVLLLAPRWFATDKNSVYWDGERLAGIDPNTLKFLYVEPGSEYIQIQDKNGTYDLHNVRIVPPSLYEPNAGYKKTIEKVN